MFDLIMKNLCDINSDHGFRTKGDFRGERV